jgi:hypothetical protein
MATQKAMARRDVNHSLNEFIVDSPIRAGH